MMGEVYMTLGLVCHRKGGSQGIAGAGYAMLSADGLACPFIGTLTLMMVLPQDPISVARKGAWVAANQDSCPVDLMVAAHNLRPSTVPRNLRPSNMPQGHCSGRGVLAGECSRPSCL